MFFGGLGLRCDVDSLVELLKEAAEKNTSGIIFLANDEMTSEVIQYLKPYADNLRMPVFELPRESIIVEITKEISSKILEEESRTSITEHLLERLCFGDAESVHEWVSKAGYYGIDLSGYLDRMNMEWDHSLIYAAGTSTPSTAQRKKTSVHRLFYHNALNRSFFGFAATALYAEQRLVTYALKAGFGKLPV
ncbi:MULTISPECIES: PucR family transcriptional regulator ligand-binding domain-containing protein [Paenibacillus]|uniref:PucR family transcriptional regulator ligand-binding domain-containing protein n=1 Tax=Paenibacillus TaxID=44249 RepID=UPI00093DC5EC|nr:MULTISPECIES: PucR family transcriptional regulator ligand-binding domain-containing protein [Paenibacillus]